MISVETPESPPSSQQPTKKSLKTLRYPVELFTTSSAIKQCLENKAVDTTIQHVRKQITAERLKNLLFECCNRGNAFRLCYGVLQPTKTETGSLLLLLSPKLMNDLAWSKPFFDRPVIF